MSTTKTPARKDSLAIYIALAFIAGFICGAAFAVYKMPSPSQQTATSTQSNMSEQQVQAIAHLEQEVTGDPEKFQAWTQLANLYYDTGQYPKAVKAYETSLKLHSGNANIWTDLGVMYRRTNQPQKAIEAFDKATAMEPSHEYSRMNKGIVLMYDLNDVDGAIEAWEGLLKINPDAKSANGDSVRAFVDNVKRQHQEQTQTITQLEQEVAANPNKFQAWTQLANLYFDTKQYDKAVNAYEKSLALDGGSANIWTDLGITYRRTDQPKKAIEAFEKAMAMDPSHQQSLLNKGIVLLYDLDDFDGAISAWEKLLKMNPEVEMANGEHLHTFIDRIKEQHKQ